MTVKKIRELGYCRSCLNEEFGLKLNSEDVLVNLYSVRPCKRCGEVKRIVRDIPLKKRWKLLF